MTSETKSTVDEAREALEATVIESDGFYDALAVFEAAVRAEVLGKPREAWEVFLIADHESHIDRVDVMKAVRWNVARSTMDAALGIVSKSIVAIEAAVRAEDGTLGVATVDDDVTATMDWSLGEGWARASAPPSAVDEAREALVDALASWFSLALHDQDFAGFSDWRALAEEAMDGHPNGAAKSGIRPAIDALIAAVRTENKVFVRGVVATALYERKVGLDTERFVLQELDAALERKP